MPHIVVDYIRKETINIEISDEEYEKISDCPLLLSGDSLEQYVQESRTHNKILDGWFDLAKEKLGDCEIKEMIAYDGNGGHTFVYESDF